VALFVSAGRALVPQRGVAACAETGDIADGRATLRARNRRTSRRGFKPMPKPRLRRTLGRVAGRPFAHAEILPGTARVRLKHASRVRSRRQHCPEGQRKPPEKGTCAAFSCYAGWRLSQAYGRNEGNRKRREALLPLAPSPADFAPLPLQVRRLGSAGRAGDVCAHRCGGGASNRTTCPSRSCL